MWSEPPETELGSLCFPCRFRNQKCFSPALLDRLRSDDLSGRTLSDVCTRHLGWPEPVVRSAILHLSAQEALTVSAPTNISGEWASLHRRAGHLLAGPARRLSGIPFNAAGRIGDQSGINSGTTEYQCRPPSAPHQWRGLGGARILKEQDPLDARGARCITSSSCGRSTGRCSWTAGRILLRARHTAGRASRLVSG